MTLRGRCPVCETTREATVLHCPRCGFPLSLATEVTLPERLSERSEATAQAPSPPVAAAPADGPSGANRALAERVLGRLPVLRELGLDPGPVELSLRDAAVRFALGETGEAEASLASTEERSDRLLVGTLEGRSGHLKARRQRLVEAGVEVPSLEELDEVTTERIRADPARALAQVARAEQRLGRVASDWQALEEALAQVPRLRELARGFGVPVDGVPDRVGPARAKLGKGPVPAAPIAEAIVEIQRELQELSEAVAPEARALLGTVLERTASGSDPLETNRVRGLREKFERQLAEGNVGDSLRDLLELRATLPPALRKARARPPAPTDAGVSTESLRAKARAFADRVRSLPANSAQAKEAAAQIHLATKLLRDGRLAEADATLTRLMQALDSAERGQEP